MTSPVLALIVGVVVASPRRFLYALNVAAESLSINSCPSVMTPVFSTTSTPVPENPEDK